MPDARDFIDMFMVFLKLLLANLGIFKRTYCDKLMKDIIFLLMGSEEKKEEI